MNDTQKPRRRPDPVAVALRRFMSASDRAIRAFQQMRQARIELAEAVESQEGREGDYAEQ